MSKKYYLQCNRGYVGNSVMWWAINDQGYTCDIRCARVWTQAEIDAKEMRSIDVPWEKETIERLVQHHIDFQDLKHKDNNDEISKFPHTLKQWRPDLCLES